MSPGFALGTRSAHEHTLITQVEWAEGAFTDLSGNPVAAGRIAFTLDAFASGVVSGWSARACSYYSS